MRESILTISQIVIAALLVGAVVLQQRGVGIGGAFGGEGNVYQTRRGVERFLFLGTIVLAVLFFGVALANILIR